MKCSICKIEGHNKRSCKKIVVEVDNKDVKNEVKVTRKKIYKKVKDERQKELKNESDIIKLFFSKKNCDMENKKKESKITCSLCKEDGHNKRSCKNKDQVEKKVEVKIETKINEDQENILSANYWKNTKTFKSIKDKETQIKYYKRMNSCEEVLQLVDLESKPFGSESEKIIQEIFKLGQRTSSQNDGTRNGKKIEIKSARYWAGKDDCVWQHLEPDHDYEYALFALLDFQGWKVWCIKKSVLMGEMRDKKIVTFQGKQGWWVRKSAIISYLTPINSISELDTFIQA